MALVRQVHDKVRNFVRNSEQFKGVCNATFESLETGQGYVRAEDAAEAVDGLFQELQQACTEYGIVLDPLTPEDVREIFKESDYDINAKLNSQEFVDFYASVVTYAAMKACAGFGRRYGTGMLAGMAGMMVAKRLLRRVPVVGAVTGPVLALFPSVLVGPLLGIAVVYGLGQNDLFAIRHKLFPPRQAALAK